MGGGGTPNIGVNDLEHHARLVLWGTRQTAILRSVHGSPGVSPMAHPCGPTVGDAEGNHERAAPDPIGYRRVVFSERAS